MTDAGKHQEAMASAMRDRRAWLARLGAAALLPLAGRPRAQGGAAAGAGGAGGGGDAASPQAMLAAGLRAGGVVLAFRHASAPGTFDPPGFDLARCETQRNLGDEGRAQAQRIGQWLRARGLAPAAVRSSPWCRCKDTARLAFGRYTVWEALGSPVGSDERARAAQQATLRQALVAASMRPGAFDAWVTHQFVLRDLTGGESTADGEALLLRAGPAVGGAAPAVQVLARAVLH